MSSNDPQTDEAQRRVEMRVGSERAGEVGGLEVRDKDNSEAWIWSDSPATVER